MYLGEDLTCYKHVRTFLLARFSSLTHPFSVCAQFEPSYNFVGPLHATNSVVKEKGIPAVTYDFQILPGLVVYHGCLALFDKLMLQDHRCKMICILLLYQYVRYGCLGNVCEDMAFALCSWRWVFQPLHSGGHSVWNSTGQKLGSWFDGFLLLYIQKYSKVLMMLYLFHLVSRCWFQRFFYLGKTIMSSPRFLRLKSHKLFQLARICWMEWKQLRCMKKGVSAWEK